MAQPQPRPRKLQADKVSVFDIVTNPTKKGSSYFYSREKIKKQLDAEFYYCLKRYRKHFSCRPIIYPDKRILYVMKIPSTDFKYNRIQYDVMIEIPFDRRKPAMRPARFISNSPSFIYTYAYVFYHTDIMINRFTDILPQQATTQYPIIRNPIGSLGFEKTIYFACKYLMNGCLTSSYERKYGVKATTGIDRRIREQVTSFNQIMTIYQHSKDLQRKTHRKPVDQTRRSERERIKQEYIQRRKVLEKSKELGPARSRFNSRKFKRIISKEN